MKTLLWFALFGVAFCGPALAKHWHDDDHGRKHDGRHDDDGDFDRRGDGCYFAPGEIRVISEYYAPRYRNLPPGQLKKLRRGQRLPPGWERKLEPLPVVVETQLVSVPNGYRRGFIDGNVVLFNPSNQLIIDVTAVFGGR